MHIFKCSGLALVFAAVGWGGAVHAGGPAMTKNFVANVAIDAPDANPGDGECNALPDPNGPKLCTLRAAIMEGNTYDEAWEVNVTLIPGMVYNLTIAGTAEDFAKTGDLNILRAMRVGVPPDSKVRAKIDAGGLDRIFNFSATPGRSALYGVEMVGGVNYLGVAVRSTAEELLIDFSDVHSNCLSGAAGTCYVIVVDDGRLEIKDSAIHNNGDEERFVNALWADGALSELVLERVTVSENAGYAIVIKNDAFLSMLSSTVSGNGVGYGSDYGVFVKGAMASIMNSTLIGNALILAQGDWQYSSATLQMTNSIVADCHIEISDAVVFQTAYNIYNDLSCGSDTPIDHSLHNTDPQLSELGDWGGHTRTHKPLPGSPAIDRAPGLYCSDPGVDQRGLPRPVAHVGNVEPRCDTGAVELRAVMVPDEPWVAEIFLDGFEAED